jgi:hypothetical protein
VDVYYFEVCLKKGFTCTAMAAVLQQDEHVSNDIQLCHSCSNNFGCHMCTNFVECVIGEDPRYCSECIIQDDRVYVTVVMIISVSLFQTWTVHFL